MAHQRPDLVGVTDLAFISDERLVFGGLMGLGALDIARNAVTTAGGPSVRRLAVVPSGLLLMGQSGLHVRALGPDAPLVAFPEAQGIRLTSMALDPGGRRVAVGGQDGQVRIFEVSTRKMVARFAVGQQPIVAFGAEHLAVGYQRGGRGRLAIRQTRGRWPTIAEIDDLNGPIADLVFSDDGALAAVTARSRQPAALLLIDVARAAVVGEWMESVSEPVSVAFGDIWMAALDRRRGCLHLWARS